MHHSLKQALDPTDVFAVNNTVYASEEERTKDLQPIETAKHIKEKPKN